MKHRVPVEWVFAKRLETPPVMRKNADGQDIAVGIHDWHTEDMPVTRIYCGGCKRHFKGWAAVLRFHRLPGEGVTCGTRTSSSKNRPSRPSRS